MKKNAWQTAVIQCVLLLQMPLACSAVTSSISMVEADWAWQFTHREPAFQAMDSMRTSSAILPAADAAGGCDGIKTGQFGFHTTFEDSPWWQVDLQKTCDLGKIIITNRGDGFAERVSRLVISVATVDGQLSKVYQHDGTVFTGHGKGAPLVVDLKGTRARWLRIHVPGPKYLHLDEVEVYDAKKVVFAWARYLPDSYVRCGGDQYRPVPVFTLHVMGPSGQDMQAISAFETFEYTPAVANDGCILYCRWDYIDRFNGHFFSLWSTHPDGTHGNLVYGNYTASPQATMEPRPIPGSDKIVFTASAHHSITGGSLVLLDRTRDTEGTAPITRLTPEVPFPEAEKNIHMFIPIPLSMTPQKGQFRLKKRTPIFYKGNQAADVARYLADFLQTATGYRLAVKPLNPSKKVTGILLRVVATESDLGREGYRLNVTRKSVIISASAPAGLFYGAQTLRQLLPPSIESPQKTRQAWIVPCVEISVSLARHDVGCVSALFPQVVCQGLH